MQGGQGSDHAAFDASRQSSAALPRRVPLPPIGDNAPAGEPPRMQQEPVP